eukprot:UC1_evm1s1764
MGLHNSLPLMMQLCLTLVVLLSYGAGSEAAHSSCAPLENHTNLEGNDILDGVPAASVSDCCSLCLGNRGCRFFTFNPTVKCPASRPSDPRGCCHLKRSDAGRAHSSVAVSGRGAPAPPPAPLPPAPPKGVRNVLIVVADDLRPNLGTTQPYMQTPSMDALAARSLHFLRAYVQQQVCSPSRNSFMTGRRPDRTRVWNFIDDYRIARNPSHAGPVGSGPGNGANWTTMPGYFKQHGYQVYGSGKLFHPNRPLDNDMPLSWTSYDDEMPGDRNHSCNNGQAKHATVVNPHGAYNWEQIVDCEENDGETLITKATIRHIEWATAPENSSRPFFIAFGHHRPHLPWTVPKRFFDRYGDPKHISVAQYTAWPESAPAISWHPWFNQNYYTDQDDSPKWRRLAYYAAISYWDYHLGLVLSALARSSAAETTAVAMWGDHGWSLGERNKWEKKGLDELDCHIPLLVAAPWITQAPKYPRTTTALAEAVDIMPTLIDLAGLPPCSGACLMSPTATNSTPAALQGVSLLPVLMKPVQSGPGPLKRYAFSQFPRCACTYDHDTPKPTRNGTCPKIYANNFTHETGATGAANMHVCLFEPSNQIDWMGYSVRSDTHRYTVYVEWDGDILRPRWNAIVARELYDHTGSNVTSFDGATSEPVNLLGLGPHIPPA